MEAESRFRAMGTDVHLVVHGPMELVEVAREGIEDLERRWSRFLPDSEVSELNRCAGSWVAVSPATVELVSRALDGWRATDGAFDPTVLGEVIRAGYDRSFEDLVDVAEAPASALHRDAAGVEVDREGSAVRLPAGVGFDPGGVGKGLAADLVADRISAEGAAGVLVNIGGDLRAVGYGPRGDDWTVDIDPADTGLPLARVALRQGGLATSTVLRRRWRVAGRPAHHVIDPRTGRPADTGIVAATVLARRGWQAEVLAKAAITRPLDEAHALLSSLGVDAVLVDEVGGLHRTPGFDRFAIAVPTDNRS